MGSTTEAQRGPPTVEPAAVGSAEADTAPEPVTNRSPALPLESLVMARSGAATTSRRHFLRTAGGLAPLGVGALALAACDAIDTDPDDLALHLVKRFSYGPTDELLEEVRAGLLTGGGSWWRRQLSPGALDYADLDARLSNLPALSMSAVELDAAYPDNMQGQIAAQLILATLIRQVHSPAQVFERMVEFWSDHFNLPLSDRNQIILKAVEDREIIRPNALGRFKDLLLASATSPAMLLYLDNAVSKVDAINENYGRELLELHTVGVGGGYDEDDVVAASRLLTGWTIDPDTGLFQFRSDWHDHSAVTIMDWTRPGGGDPFQHGVDFLHWLAVHPSTAQFLARKLAVRFVSDVPDQGLVDDLAASYLANDTRIDRVLQTLVSHPAYQAAVGQKFRRPIDAFGAALRATGAELTSPPDVAGIGPSLSAFAVLGQTPFQWPAPNGYPDVAGAWMTNGGLLSRWNATGQLCGGLATPVITSDLSWLTTDLEGKSVSEAVDTIADHVVHEALSDDGRDIVLFQLGYLETPDDVPPPAFWPDAAPRVAAMLLCTGDFQYR